MKIVSRWARKSDRNQPEVVSALRAGGWSVRHLHRVGSGLPDLLVAHNEKANVLVEVKMQGEGLTVDEKHFFETWPGPKIIAFSGQDALDKLRRWWR